MKDNSLKTIELEMTVLVRRIASITANLNEKQERMDRSAYLLLNQLAVEGTAGVKTLATTLQLDISTVSRQVAALEQKGYIKKTPNPEDGRAYFYHPTELGLSEWTKYKQMRVDKLSALLQTWSEEDCEQFGKLLNKFNHSVTEYYCSPSTKK